jgi:hypothetical protein
MESQDAKEHARIRRQNKLELMQDGWPYFDRQVPSGKKYQRNLKYRPQTPDDWEELED